MKQNKAKCSNNLLFSFAKRSKNEEKWFLFHFALFLNEKNKKGKWDNLDAGGSFWWKWKLYVSTMNFKKFAFTKNHTDQKKIGKFPLFCLSKNNHKNKIKC